MRNISHRPTAIIDIYAINSDGVIINNIGEKDEVHLPIKVDPWDVKIISFRVESHENEKSNIMLRDIDDNKIVVTRDKGTIWHE